MPEPTSGFPPWIRKSLPYVGDVFCSVDIDDWTLRIPDIGKLSGEDYLEMIVPCDGIEIPDQVLKTAHLVQNNIQRIREVCLPLLIETSRGFIRDQEYARNPHRWLINWIDFTEPTNPDSYKVIFFFDDYEDHGYMYLLWIVEMNGLEPLQATQSTWPSL